MLLKRTTSALPMRSSLSSLILLQLGAASMFRKQQTVCIIQHIQRRICRTICSTILTVEIALPNHTQTATSLHLANICVMNNITITGNDHLRLTYREAPKAVALK